MKTAVPHTSILVKKADCHLIGEWGNNAAQSCKSMLMPRQCVVRRKENRIIAPDQTSLSHPFAQTADIRQNFTLFPQTWFQVFSVRRKRHLEIVPKSTAVKLIQIRHKWSRILRPENDSVHTVRRNGDSANLRRTPRIAAKYKAVTHTFHKPFRIMARDIRAAGN